MSPRSTGLSTLALSFALSFTPAVLLAHNGTAPQVDRAATGDSPVDAATAARLAALNNRVIAAIGEYQASGNTKRGQVAARLKPLAQDREVLMRATLESAPGLVLRTRIPGGMTQSLPADVRQVLERDVKVDGRIIVLHADDFAYQAVSNRYYVESTDAGGRSTRTRLHAADRPDRPGVQHPAGAFVGQQVTVHATAIGDALLIAGAESIAAASTGGTTGSGSTAIAAAATVSGTQNTLVLTAGFSDKGLSCSGTDIYNKVFGTTNSVADFYQQSSKGNVTFAGAMYGPYQLSVASTATCDFQTWSAQLETMAASQGINLSAYSRRVFVFPTSSCGIGYGTVGAIPSRAWIFRCDLIDLFTHEVGHNLGFQHSSTPGSEYGDTSDVMGYSGLALRHNNAPNKVTTGWLGASWVRSVSGSGIFTLDPTATSTPVNPQVLTLPKPDTGDTYFISFRQPIGYDATLATSYRNLVSIHRGSTSMGQYTYLLGTVAAGGTYTDATNGYTFAVNSIGTTSATVSVTATAATCTRAAPGVTMTPLSQSAAAGNSISYQVTVTNNNNSGCGPATFAFSAAIPSGWSSSDSPATLSLSSGSSGSAIWTVAAASTAVQQSYAIGTTAYDTAATTMAGTVQGTFVVTATDSILPTVAITSPLNGATVGAGKVVVSASATDNVGVAKVDFYVDGTLMATDTAAPYSFNWNTRRISNGSHTLKAVATDAAGNSASSTVTVTK